MHRICIINVFFGELPNYFPLWLNSCAYNKTVDFLIITDQLITGNPRNVRKIYMSFDEFVNMVQSKFDFEISLKRPYKICDFKPAFGIICEEYLKEYDFWGHCDLDMIFGDLRKYFTSDLLNYYDKILPLGHLSLYRNTNEINNRFKLEGSLVGNYKEVFTSDRGYAFDEMKGIYQIYKKNGFPVYDKRIFADISEIYKRFRLALNDINYKHQIFSFENGKVYREYYIDGEYHKEEFIYIHIKKPKNLKINFELDNYEKYFITNTGFQLKHGNADLQIINRYNKYQGVLYESFEKIKYKFKGKLINLSKRFSNMLEKKIWQKKK